jgi:hypothetical protein
VKQARSFGDLDVEAELLGKKLSQFGDLDRVVQHVLRVAGPKP